MLDISFRQFFTEAFVVEASEGVLQHLSHLEELILTNQNQGAEMIVQFLNGLLDTFKGKVDSPIYTTIKFDGAPSIVAGYNPENNDFFVSTKSITNVQPKINYTDLDIDKNHGHAPGLAKKLKIALKYLPAIIRSGIYQGDFMFSKEDLNTTQIDGEDLILFKPNTITYAVEQHSPLGQRILAAQMGVVFHTKLTGKDLSTLQSSPNVSVSEFNQTQDVFLDDAKFKDLSGLATLTLEETKTLEKLIATITNLSKKVKWDQISPEIYTHIKTFVNNLIRQGQFVDKPQETYSSFINWITTKSQTETKTLKTEKGKQKRQAAFQEYLKKIEGNQANVVNLLNLTKKIDQAKKMFISKYNSAIKTKQFITQPDGTLKVTAPEGYVAVDHLGNMVKLVDRLEFSKANFAVSKEQKFS